MEKYNAQDLTVTGEDELNDVITLLEHKRIMRIASHTYSGITTLNLYIFLLTWLSMNE